MKRFAIGAAAVALASCGSPEEQTEAETYRLVHAIGNAENIAAEGLSQAECHQRRDELKETAAALGTYNEATGYGSITCLPESIFAS